VTAAGVAAMPETVLLVPYSCVHTIFYIAKVRKKIIYPLAELEKKREKSDKRKHLKHREKNVSREFATFAAGRPNFH